METYESLTPREKEALELSCKDLSGPRIAKRWIQSKHTPKNHLYNAKKKLKVRTIPGAITRAHQLRLINLDELKIE